MNSNIMEYATTDIINISNEQKVIDEWLNALDVKADTKDTYFNGLNKFLCWLKANNINQVSKPVLLDFKKFLVENYSSATVSLYISSLKSFYGFLASENKAKDIAIGLKGCKVAKGYKKDIFSLEQLSDILGSIDKTTLLGMRDFCLISLLLRCGLRTCEIQRANIEDIHYNNGSNVLLYIKGKGRDEKDEYVVLTTEMQVILNDYLCMRGKYTDTVPLFISLSDRNFGSRLSKYSIRWIVKNHLRNVNINSKRLSTHSFRHTAISLAFNGGADLVSAKEMARHNSVNTTLIYLHNL